MRKRRFILIAALLLVAVAGTAGWLLRDTIFGRADANPWRYVSDLDLVPGDSVLFFSINVHDVWQSSIQEKIEKTFFPDETLDEQTVKSRIGLHPAQMERITVFAPAGTFVDLSLATGLFAILRTKLPYDWRHVYLVLTEKVYSKRGLPTRPAPLAKYPHVEVAILNDKTLLFGNAGTLSPFLKRATRTPGKGPRSQAIRMAAKGRPIVFSADLPKSLQDLFPVSPGAVVGEGQFPWQKVRTALDKALKNRRENLKKIARAMQRYHDEHGRLPHIDLGAGLSWRVALLKYLGHEELCRQFDLKQPWNSAKNKAILAKIPRVFTPELSLGKSHGKTLYRVFAGPKSAFENPEIRLADFEDRPAATMLVVEAPEAVPWTKPGGMPFDPNKPRPRIGSLFGDRVLSIFADGRVRPVLATLPAAALKAYVTRNGHESPLGLDLVEYPLDNQPDGPRIRLGKQLFFDPRLSRDLTISCASCHDPNKGWGNGKRFATGVGGRVGKRNAPTIMNAVYSLYLFWDGAVTGLEEQVLGPIQNPIEMDMTVPELEKRLNAIAGYREQFKQVFGSMVTIKNIARAIAAYERTVLAGESPYDRYVAGDTSALTDSARRGMKLFFGKAGCEHCHSPPDFIDIFVHNIGIGMDKKDFDKGRYVHTKDRRHMGAFKTPSIREIANTAPYMHDGSMKTLEEVVRYYNRGGNKNPYLDANIRPLNLSEREMDDLVSFLRNGLSRPDYVKDQPPELPK